jgi:hypothetical protein
MAILPRLDHCIVWAAGILPQSDVSGFPLVSRAAEAFELEGAWPDVISK